MKKSRGRSSTARAKPALTAAEEFYGGETAGDSYVPLHGNRGYRVLRYELDLHYRVPSNRLSGRARISAVAEQPLSRLTLDLAKLTVDRVKVNGQAAAMFTQWGSKLHIWPAELLPAGATVDLLVSYAGNPVPIGGRWGQLGWDELADGVIVASQPNGAPSWFPCNDHPSSKATYQISVTADSAYQVIANGILVAKRRGSSQTTWTYHQPEPMASYLATVQIGRYQIFQLATKPVSIKAAIPARRLPAFNDSFGRQQHMMKLFCRLFGPYPFAGYTVVITDDALEIPLEAQGISIFGSNFIDGRRGSERLIAHELAHQWFGNSVTLKSWRHIWLHEGFACYAEWLWAENSGGLPADAAARAARSSLLRQPQDLAIGDPGPDRMFDSRVYLRGALTVHALRQQMGDQAFFRLIRDWLSNHRHGTANTEQFLELAASQGGDEQAVRRWLFETALPPEF